MAGEKNKKRMKGVGSWLEGGKKQGDWRRCDDRGEKQAEDILEVTVSDVRGG